MIEGWRIQAILLCRYYTASEARRPRVNISSGGEAKGPSDKETGNSPNREQQEHGTYMIMGNVVEEVTSDPTEEGPVHGCECATKECPFLVTVVWYCGIGMVKIC